MKDINVAYIHEMSMREGTLADNTVILNTATVAESIHVDGRFTTKSSPETYTQSVINNEIVHAYLRQKYGKLTDGAFPV
ncbi:hypothetical protein KBC03_06470 [Patescibacteria group bacterium]|nr:hypothetical protein [Patescibacteria group bacterium]